MQMIASSYFEMKIEFENICSILPDDTKLMFYHILPIHFMIILGFMNVSQKCSMWKNQLSKKELTGYLEMSLRRWTCAEEKYHV